MALVSQKLKILLENDIIYIAKYKAKKVDLSAKLSFRIDEKALYSCKKVTAQTKESDCQNGYGSLPELQRKADLPIAYIIYT
jgi:hypothetical protein